MSVRGQVSIAAVGDIMPGISYKWLYLSEPEERFSAHRLLEGEEIIEAEPKSSLLHADLTIGNMEAVISKAYTESKSRVPPLLMAPADTAEFLADSGFDIVHIDNNHILDHGEDHVIETKSHLESAGIDYIGSPLGKEQPITVSRNGTAVHLAGFNLCAEGHTSDLDHVLNTARELGTRSGMSILSIHWGWRKVHTLKPSPDQVKLARDIADSGVDIILGHHSHTFQPVERYNDTVIAYSLGNFIFDMWRPDNRESGILEMRGCPSEEDPWNQVTVTPVENQHGIVSPASIPRISNAVTTDVSTIPEEEYEEYAVQSRKTHQREVIKKYVRNARRIPLDLQVETLRGWSTKALRKLWERKAPSWIS